MNSEKPSIPASRDQRWGKEAQRKAIYAEQEAGIFDADAHLRESPMGRFLAAHPRANPLLRDAASAPVSQGDDGDHGNSAG